MFYNACVARCDMSMCIVCVYVYTCVCIVGQRQFNSRSARAKHERPTPLNRVNLNTNASTAGRKFLQARRRYVFVICEGEVCLYFAMSSNMTFLIVAAFFSFSLSIANACSCMPSHPQDKFCYADFVVLARVKREQVVNGTRIYKIRIRKEYKMSEKSYVALKSGRLLTAEEDSMCGIRLQLGKMYAISGKVVSLQARVNLCGLIQRWETLTPRQRKGLRKSYQQGCTCQIKPCRLPHCRKTRDSCSWSTFRYGHHNDCLYQEGTCLRSVSKQCVWSKNVVQSGCLRKARPKQHHHLPFLDGPDRKFGQ